MSQISQLSKLSKKELLILLSTLLDEQKASKSQWDQLYSYFKKLGTDPTENIKIIVEHLGKILGSGCAASKNIFKCMYLIIRFLLINQKACN